MANRTKKSVLGHAQLDQKKELQLSDGLPFRRLLGEDRVSAALARAGVEFRDRIYPPKVTLWAWLSQVTADKDASCTDAVGRVIADRAAHHQVPCSPDSSSYCTARGRLPEQVITDLAQETGQELHRQAKSEWLWKDRRVVIVDGSTATMADTEENQAEYPQSRTQKAGLGFPILRFVVLLSLAVGTVLDGEQYSAEDLTDLFRERWHIELDLRSIKRSLGMHHLSSQSPEMVRKELWMHLLSYNLIRVRMAQAAALYGLMPRTLSFIAAKTLMDSFAPHLNVTSGAEHHRLEAELLRAIAHSPVKDRPGRVEPRAVKKRVQKYSYLTKPRTQARKQVAA